MTSRRTNLLAVLRRQRDRLGRLVLAGFALASFTISGAQCFAMGGKIDVAAHAAPVEIHHVHSGHAMGHVGNGAAVTHDDGSAQKGVPHCPHCPPGMPNHAPSSDHSYCSAGDDLADQTLFSAPPSFAKYVFVSAAFEAPPPLAFHAPPRSTPRVLEAQRSTIALNLRNCVFLI